MTEQAINDGGSPGSHPHSDRPNWQPGDDERSTSLFAQKIADAQVEAFDHEISGMPKHGTRGKTSISR